MTLRSGTDLFTLMDSEPRAYRAFNRHRLSLLFCEAQASVQDRSLAVCASSERRTSFGRNAAMMRKQQQYRTSDDKRTFIDFRHRPEAPVRACTVIQPWLRL
jgi:hypothetical protein